MVIMQFDSIEADKVINKLFVILIGTGGNRTS